MAAVQVVGVISFLITVVYGETCTSDDGSSVECADDQCCGSSYNRYCCWIDDVSDAVSTGLIAGAVIGGLFFLALIVGTVVAIYCCMKRSRARQGQVIGGNTMMVTSNTTTPYSPGNTTPYSPAAYQHPPTTNYAPQAAPYAYGQPQPGYGHAAPQQPMNAPPPMNAPLPSYDAANSGYK